MKSDLVDVTVCLHHETKQGMAEAGGILVSDDGDRSKAVWLPKSQVEVEFAARDSVIVTMPEWLAHDKGLI